MIIGTVVTTPIGRVLIEAADSGICSVRFLGRKKYYLRKFGAGDGRIKEYLEIAIRELEEYFKGKLRSFSVPLDSKGTDFQQKVWNELKKIPYGETISYSEMANRVGSPNACRAAGRACASNRIPIFIPCHRVINKDSNAGGFSGGANIKKILLKHERRSRF